VCVDIVPIHVDMKESKSILFSGACMYSHIVYNTTGWRRLIGCLELQVIFRKRATNYRALLQKMTYGDKASYDSTPPCTTERLYPVYNSCVLLQQSILHCLCIHMYSIR